METFYARAADSKDTTKSSNTSSISTQNIDNSFKDFVWKQLASLPELKVAFLRKLGNDHAAQGGTPDPGAANADTPAGENNEAGQASTPVPAPIASTSTALLDDEGNPIDQGAFNLKNKAKIKAARQNDQSRHRDARLTGDQYEFVEIPQEEIQTSTREQLLEKYGNTLRIAADPETCYVALTGSHERVSCLVDPCLL